MERADGLADLRRPFYLWDDTAEAWRRVRGDLFVAAHTP
jgi:hypothetical protein